MQVTDAWESSNCSKERDEIRLHFTFCGGGCSASLTCSAAAAGRLAMAAPLAWGLGTETPVKLGIYEKIYSLEKLLGP